MEHPEEPPPGGAPPAGPAPGGPGQKPPPPPAPTVIPGEDDDIPEPEFDKPLGLQRIITEFLDAELLHSVRAYHDANYKLDGILRAADASARGGHRLPSGVARVASTAIQLNGDLLKYRHAVGLGHRRPPPPPPLIDSNGARRLLNLYDVAERALSTDVRASNDDLEMIRQSMLLDPDGDESPSLHAQRLRERFVHRQLIAAKELGFDPEAGEPAAASEFSLADLEQGGDWIATDVLLVLKQAHLDVHEVEHRRSQSVEGMLGRSKGDIVQERELLRHSIVLSTLALVAAQVVPWAFATDAGERQAIQGDPAKARGRIDPPEAMWVARQVTMMSLYRRAHGFRLLGDHERSYNDYRKLQRIGRLSRPRIGGSPANITERNMYVDILSALGEYRIGELYRSDHDYTQALAHLCAGHELLLHAGLPDIRPGDEPPEVRWPRLEVHLRLSKGTAYFETGEMTRALKWHVLAWISLEELIDLDATRHGLTPERRAIERDAVEALASHLEGAKDEPNLDKENVKHYLGPAVDVMCARDVPPPLGALAGDVLGRIGHILLVLALPDDITVPRCLKRAVTLDSYNLFARTALMRWRLMEELDESGTEKAELPDPATLPDAVTCWPSGASDVDQAIRVGIHLLLRRLLEEARSDAPENDVDMRVARALVARFIDHTDSIYLRLEVINHYLMRPRLEAQRPELAEQPPAEPYMQLVSLRRHGGLTTSIPRPAEVSAVGGGYLVRVCSPSADPDEWQDVFNILVDPGEGLIDNLYREGFGIADIDMVIMTNDHHDHLAALDAILALRKGSRPVDRNRANGPERLVMLGTDSVRQRYRGHEQMIVRDLRNPFMHLLPDGISIQPLHAIDEETAGYDPVSFVVTFEPPTGTPRSITFMSDAATEALGDYVDGRIAGIDREAVDAWKAALANDVVVANVGEVSVGELRDLALPDGQGKAGGHVADAFDGCVAELDVNGRSVEADRIRRALTLPPGPDRAGAGLLKSGLGSELPNSDHLNLGGLLAVARLMREPSEDDSVDRPRVLVVRELREQIGAFRRTIADEINRHLFADATVALTADVGLRIRLDSAHRSRVLCSVCSLNNDRLEAERHHHPGRMTEVCVRGDGEATYWMCPIHESERSVFIVHRGGFRPRTSRGNFKP